MYDDDTSNSKFSAALTQLQDSGGLLLHSCKREKWRAWEFLLRLFFYQTWAASLYCIISTLSCCEAEEGNPRKCFSAHKKSCMEPTYYFRSCPIYGSSFYQLLSHRMYSHVWSLPDSCGDKSFIRLDQVRLSKYRISKYSCIPVYPSDTLENLHDITIL